jgi:Na+-driven multidrug efflux pump
LTVAVIGKLVGTREVSAYVIVHILVELVTEFVGGFHEALVTLCSQAIGARKPRLAGKYVQIATILYILCYMPFALIWFFKIDAAIRWFGFDEETVRIGQHYGYVLLVYYLINGVGEAVHGLLDCAGFASYSTFIGALQEVVAFLTILLCALVGSPSLLTIGIIQFGMGVLFLCLNIFIIWRNGWFLPYRDGMVGTFALSVSTPL